MRDVRYAIRILARHPAFTAVAVVTLALGIGATAAIFTVINAVLLRPLPFVEPERLVLLVETMRGFPTLTTSWQNYGDWRDQSRAFEVVAAFRNTTMTLTGGGEPERVTAKMTTASLLPALGVDPILGRRFTAADDKSGAPGVALITAGLWQRRFGGAPDILSRAIVLDNAPYTVVGVLPAGFRLMQQADVLLPMGPWAATLPDDRSWHPGIWPLARLNPRVSLDQARAEMKVIAERLATQYPDFDKGVTVDVRPLHEFMVQNVRQGLLVLAAAIGFVLLIACANVANLLLGRALGRRKEIAVRTALGAGRRRLVVQLLTESLVLSILGAGAGLLVAFWTLPLVSSLAASPSVPSAPVSIDGSALLFTLAVAVVTGIVFGLAPAIQIARVDVVSSINEGGRGGGSGGRQHRMRSLLVVAEMALATMLLVAAGLLIHSLSRLQNMPTGFDPGGIVLADTPLSPGAYGSAPRRESYVDRLLAELRSLQGVREAAVTTAPPFSGNASAIHFNIVGRPPKGPDEFVLAGYRAVTSRYFAALGVGIKQGRVFEESDREGSAPVVVVNEAFARRFFGGGRTTGNRVQIGALPDPQEPMMEIVGVVADFRDAYETDPQPMLYLPYFQRPDPIIEGMYRNVAMVVRADRAAESIIGDLRSIVSRVDRDQPLVHVRTMKDAMAESVAQPRLRTRLLTLFSLVALALSIIGVYGVMAYAVSERTHEIGVRMALGATPAQVRSLVVGDGARLAVLGIALGIAGAMATGRALQSLLFRVGAVDVVALVAAVAAVAVAAFAASYGPARRATRVNPARLLK